ncbi:MAG: hypothetical protein C4317_00605 [Acidimicrobiia bacterium]
MTAENDEESSAHAKLGADLVLVPCIDAADLATAAVCEVLAVKPPRVLSPTQTAKNNISG